VTQTAVPAVWMRGGTSKGLFFHEADLPAEPAERRRWLLRLLGSPDPYGKQIDGLGGATSSTSKVVVIAPSRRDDCDVDYWFGHVAISSATIDYSGNCGNLTAAVGPFAIDEGLVPAQGNSTQVRIWQVNIGKRILADVPVDGARARVIGDFRLDGVPFPGAAIRLRFEQAGGGEDGSVLPTGQPVDRLPTAEDAIEATLIHAGNPAVFVRAEDLQLTGTETAAQIDRQPALLARLDDIRAVAAVRMGLAPSVRAARDDRPATPKIHWVGAARDHRLANARRLEQTEVDLCARALSMGRGHHAFPGTSGIALAVAAALPGSVLSSIPGIAAKPLRIGHASGVMQVTATLAREQGVWKAPEVCLERSARRLMQGEVLLP